VSQEDIAAAERRGYSRGYAAGQKRLEHDSELQAARRDRQAFMDRAFLACIPFVMDYRLTGWKRGDRLVQTLDDRAWLAAQMAEAMAKARPYAP
jgi:hypothetical protein